MVMKTERRECTVLAEAYNRKMPFFIDVNMEDGKPVGVICHHYTESPEGVKYCSKLAETHGNIFVQNYSGCHCIFEKNFEPFNEDVQPKIKSKF